MRKTVIFALAFMCVLMLCGCGQTRNEAVQSNNTPTSVPVSKDTPVPEPTVTDTPTPEPTVTDTPTPEPTATDTPTPEPTATNTPLPTPAEEPKPTNTPTPTPTPVSKLSVKTGDVIKMGTYAGEKLEWKVIATEGDKALIITTKAISAKAYNNSLKGTSWKDCSLRDWMNGEFLKSFDSDEKSKFAETNNDGSKDKAFALSVSEIKKYLSAGSGQNKDLAVKAAESANKEGCYIALEGDWWKGNCSYWLRDAITGTKSAAYVEPDGFIADYGCLVSDDTIGVRPAMWIYPGKK